MAASVDGGWRGRRSFEVSNKEIISDAITRFKFIPTDGQPTPSFKPGQYITLWVNVGNVTNGPYDTYTEQPRHYTLALLRNPDDRNKSFSISVKKDGLVSQILHDQTEIGDTFDLSPPFGCFDLSGVEQLWLTDNDTPVVFISGGVGMTPVLAMLENIYLDRPASWLHAAENGKVHAYRDRLREIAAVRAGKLQRRVWYPPGGDEAVNSVLYNVAKYHYHGLMDLSDASQQQRDDFPPEVLHLNNPHTQYYMCGPPSFMDTQKENLLSLGVDGSRIHWEGF